MKKITFITRHYPPSLNVNGESVCDLAAWLHVNYGITSRIITIEREADGLGGSRKEPVGEVIRIKTLFNNKKAFFRFFSFLYDGYVLAKRALKYKDSFVVVTTSPPLLPMWASILFPKQLKWALWSLDLFPEGFMVMGKAKPTNFLYKWCLKKTYDLTPDLLISLGPKQSIYLQQQYRSKIRETILPCGVFFFQDISMSPPDWYTSDKIVLGYCGNVHDPHNPDFIKRVIDQIDPRKHLLVLALYGSRAPELIAYANGKPGVLLVKNVPRSQLHYIDVHMVTLRDSWTHIAVPSKAVSAISMGCPVLFCGSKESDNWYLLQNAGWYIPEDENMTAEIQSFLSNITVDEINRKKTIALQKSEELKKIFQSSYHLIARFSQGDI